MDKMSWGNLYLIPSMLGESSPGMAFPPANLEIISGLDCFIVEEVKTARRFLRSVGIKTSFEQISFMIFNEHTGNIDVKPFLEPALHGRDTGLLSEAGTPCIADPGSEIVKKAHELGIRVIPLVGPSSILLSLVASGFNGQHFSFLGYLPVEKNQRIRRIKEVEKEMYEKDVTQIFIETPYRNLQLFQALVDFCHPETLLCLATDVNTLSENIQTRTIHEWRSHQPDIHKRPTVFLVYK